MAINEFGLDQISEKLPSNIDIFVCSSSFEERCLVASRNINVENVRTALIAENKNNLEYVGSNGIALREIFGDKAIDVKLETSNPTLCLTSFSNAFMNVRSEQPQEVVVDITTFTHESLLVLLRFLSYNLKKGDNVQFIYTGASEYSVGLADGDKWLSKGIRDIRSVLGYPGIILPSRRTHLIVMVGFESERAGELIERLEPSLLSLGYGAEDSSITPEHYLTNRVFFERLFRERIETQYRGNLSYFGFAPNDPLDTMKALKEQIDGNPDYNVIIAAMNTKVSTLGAALTAFQNNDIQLCYAEAELYNMQNYSTPKHSFYLFSPKNFNINTEDT